MYLVLKKVSEWARKLKFSQYAWQISKIEPWNFQLDRTIFYPLYDLFFIADSKMTLNGLSKSEQMSEAIMTENSCAKGLKIWGITSQYPYFTLLKFQSGRIIFDHFFVLKFGNMEINLALITTVKNQVFFESQKIQFFQNFKFFCLEIKNIHFLKFSKVQLLFLKIFEKMIFWPAQ